jgi:transketolase
MAYGELGPTHHSIEDLAWMRAIAELTVMMPADPQQTRGAVRWAAGAGVPVFMRVGRFPVPAVTPEGQPFEAGRTRELRPGRDVALVATGTMVSRALAAAEILDGQGISARVLNVARIKPLEEEPLLRAAAETGRIVTAEEAVVQGGLGGAVAELVAQRSPARMRILGVTGFAPTGDTAFLLEHFGLTADGIAAAARELMG